MYVFNVSKPLNYYGYALTVILGFLSIVTFAGRRYDRDIFTLIAPCSFIIMGIWSITISLFILNELINALNLIFKIKSFRYYSTLIVVIVSIIASIWSLINAMCLLRINEVVIKVPELKIPSLSIVQLSDIHINAYTKYADINRIFEKAASFNPDIIVLTGDIIDTDILKNDKYKEFGFEKLKAKYGVFSVTGNHDHYTGVKIFYELFKRLNIKVLDDETVLIDNIINVAGINDVSYRSDDMIFITLSDADKNYPVLFLSHRPEPFNYISEIEGYKIIQVSGHTHGGQIPPIEIVRRFFMKYNLGLYYSGNAVMFVSSGTRWWGPPMRFGNTSEISVIKLER
jgi:predicted MPP superfamily phosphohydrolase